MKTKFLLLLILPLTLAAPAFADSPPWTGDATYTFSDADDPFGENGIYDTATVNIIGGSFGSLGCYEYSTVNMSGGTGSMIGTDDHSVLHLSGGNLNSLGGESPSQIHVYALDYQIDQGPYYYQLTGHWKNGNEFDISISDLSWPIVNMHIIPEPCTLSILALGAFLIRKRATK